MKQTLKTFPALTDTPSTYTGQAKKLVEVNAAEDALEFTSEIVGPILVRDEDETTTNATTLLEGEIAKTSDTGSIRLGDGVTEGGLAGNMASSAMILCPAIGTPAENAARLRALYTEAKTYTPNGLALSATNRVVIHLGTGTYDFELGDVADLNHGLELDTQFIDLAGITGNPADVILTSAIATASRGTVEQTADDVRLSGFTMEITSASSTGSNGTEASAYFPAFLTNTVLSDVICQSETTGVNSMRTFIEYAGTYTRVTGGQKSFGYFEEASGTFTDCVGGNVSFGSSGTASGTFTDCVSGADGFGYSGTASGTFINCTGGPRSFGAVSGTLSGTFIECRGDYGSFDGTFTAAAKLYDCLLETGSGTGIYAYLPENVKRKNGSDSPSDTGIDMTSTATITWANASGYALQVSSDLVLANLDTGAETFSVAITSASGANTFTSTKASGATWTIPIPQFLGSVADAANYVIEISTDNVANTSVNYTLNVVEQAVL